MNCACPKCGQSCEYSNDVAEFAIECGDCKHVFIPQSREKIEAEPKAVSAAGNFYRAVFVDTWKVFALRRNYILIGLVITITVFKFFVAGILCVDHMENKMLTWMYITGWILKILLWGWFAGIYFTIAHETAMGYDDLTDEVDDAFTAIMTAFASSIGRPILLFYYAMIGSLIPWLIGMTIIALAGKAVAGLGIFLHIMNITLLACGLFLFPAAMLTIAVTEDILTMRPDYFLRPVIRAFRPYLVVLAFTIAGAAYWLFIGDMDAVAGRSPVRITVELLLNIGFQFFAIITMRTIGLYYRHYHKYFPW